MKDAQILSPVRDQLKAKGVGPLYSWHDLSHLPAHLTTGVTSLNLGKLKVDAKVVDDVKAKKGWNVKGEDDGLVLFTSGTTSLPKGVLITQRQGMQHIHTASIRVFSLGLG